MRVLVLTPPGTPADVADAIQAALAAGGHERLDPPPPPRPLAQAQREWFLATVDRMHEADAVLADVSAPNASAAWAVAWFLARGRLAVLACAADARETLSPVYAGNPSPWQRLVTYSDAPDLREQLS